MKSITKNIFILSVVIAVSFLAINQSVWASGSSGCSSTAAGCGTTAAPVTTAPTTNITVPPTTNQSTLPSGCYSNTDTPNPVLDTSVSAGSPCPAGEAYISNGVQTPQTNGNLPNYVPLEPIPGFNETGNANFGQLLSQIFKVLIIIGALIAVGAFVFAGISYMVSDVVDVKSEARKRLTSAFYGLLLLIASWVILYTINPQLVTFGGGISPQTGNFAPITTAQTPLNQIQQDANTCASQSNGGGTLQFAPTGGTFTCPSSDICTPMSSGGVCVTSVSGTVQQIMTTPLPN